MFDEIPCVTTSWLRKKVVLAVSLRRVSHNQSTSHMPVPMHIYVTLVNICMVAGWPLESRHCWGCNEDKHITGCLLVLDIVPAEFVQGVTYLLRCTQPRSLSSICGPMDSSILKVSLITHRPTEVCTDAQALSTCWTMWWRNCLQKLAQFLLIYHTTSNAITGVAPAKHFLKRKLRTWLELMKPS